MLVAQNHMAFLPSNISIDATIKILRLFYKSVIFFLNEEEPYKQQGNAVLEGLVSSVLDIQKKQYVVLYV